MAKEAREQDLDELRLVESEGKSIQFPSTSDTTLPAIQEAELDMQWYHLQSMLEMSCATVKSSSSKKRQVHESPDNLVLDIFV